MRRQDLAQLLHVFREVRPLAIGIHAELVVGDPLEGRVRVGGTEERPAELRGRGPQLGVVLDPDDVDAQPGAADAVICQDI